MTDQDGYRLEAAEQFGFTSTNDEADEYACTEAQLIAFAKACERKGRAEVRAMAYQARCWDDSASARGALTALIERVDVVNSVTDAELAPILEAEEARAMTAAGYVRGTDEPGKRWVKL